MSTTAEHRARAQVLLDAPCGNDAELAETLLTTQIAEVDRLTRELADEKTRGGCA